MVKNVEEVPIFGKQYKGIVQAVKPLKTKDGTPYLGLWLDVPGSPDRLTVFAFADYATNLKFVQKGDQLSLLNVTEMKGKMGGAILKATNKSIVVVDADYLIPVQAILDAKECPRRAYVKIMGADGEIHDPWVPARGVLVHAIHTRWLRGNDDYAYLVADTLMKQAHDLILKGVDVEEAYRTLLEYEHAMGDEIDPELTESVTFLNPVFGLRGEIDVLSKNRIFELKSKSQDGKIPYQPWRRDQNQAVLYGASAVLHYHDYELIVRYLHPIQGKVDYSLGKLEDYQNHLPSLIRARNLVWFMLHERFIPPPLANGSKECQYCFVKQGCSLLCSGLTQFESCNSCALKESCSQKPWATGEQEFYKTYITALLDEERHLAYQLRELWLLPAEARVDAGNAIKLGEPRNAWEPIGINKGIQSFHVKNTSTLRKGEPVIISFGSPIQERYIQGRIKSIYKDSIEIESSSPLQPGMYVDKSSGSYLLYRDRKAVFQFIMEPKRAQHYLHHLLFQKPWTNSSVKYSLIEHETYLHLNPSQKQAVTQSLAPTPIHLIKGPPGTGKTFVIGVLITQLIQQGARVLALAYTNTAVDNMLKTFLQLTPTQKLLRLGNESSIEPSLWDYSFQNTAIMEAKVALESSQVIFATTSKITAIPTLADLIPFDVVIIDESSQISLPGVLSSIRQAPKIILVGDEKQLPAVITSVTAKTTLEDSLFSQLQHYFPPTSFSMLEYQYRMNDIIMRFPSQKFYDNKLKSASKHVANQTLSDLKFNLALVNEHPYHDILDPEKPLIGIHLLTPPPTKEKHNPYEINLVTRLVKYLIDGGVYPPMIGVIAPFRAQVSALRARLPEDVTVDTVDRFQGSDREIIIFSSVNGSDLKPSNFITDEKRFNVSITRAKKKLIVIATSIAFHTLAPLLQDFFHYAKTQHSYYSFKEKPYFNDPLVSILVTKALIPIHERNGTYRCFLSGKKHTGIHYQCPVCHSTYLPELLEEYVENNGECPVCKELMRLTDYYYTDQSLKSVVTREIQQLTSKWEHLKTYTCWSCSAVIERTPEGFPGYCTQCGAMVSCMLCRQPLLQETDVMTCPNGHAAHSRGMKELKRVTEHCPICNEKL